MSNENMTSSPKWSPEQELAINLRGGNVLVTASAGSGKTAVLTERILRRIVSDDNPADIRRFVVVTFMKAAAAELKERLSAKLGEYLLKHPENRRIKCQLMYVREANISTIDSFCLSLIERYQSAADVGYVLGIKIASETEEKLLFSKAISEAIEAEYEKGDKNFYALTDALDNGRSNDNELREALKKLHSIFRTVADSEGMKKDILASYGNDYCDISKSAFFGSLFEKIAVSVSHYLKETEALLTYVPPQTDDKKINGYKNILQKLLSTLQSIAAAAQKRNAATCENEARSADFPNFPVKPKENAEWYEKCGKLKKEALEFIRSLSKEFKHSEKSLREEAATLKLITKKLFELSDSAEKKYAALKKDRGLWDYDDIELKAVEILWEKDENGVLRRTEISKEEGGRYDEILIDEYQDVNEVQELIFRGISSPNEDDIFMVGDVKQSIYGFRGATPKLFMKHRDDYNPASAEESDTEFPALVRLNNNYRSSKEITSAVNAVFNAVMTKEVCGADYTDEELVPAAEYKESAAAGAYFTIVESKTEDEAEYVASKIRELMKSGMTVREKRGRTLKERPLEYCDIAILLRVGREKTNVFLNALTEAGIPASAPLSGAWINAPAVRRMIAILRAIDNPMKDINLVAAMSSGIFGFTESELVRIRKKEKGAFYYAVKACAESGDKKCSDFISEIEHLRRKSAVLTAEKLIWYIYKSTGYLAFASTLKNGERERRSFMRLYESAKAYGEFGRQDLSGFIGYIDRLIDEKTDVGENTARVGENEVRIMTIHKSKGLEFPVCFICCVESPFNRSDTKTRFIADADIGIGMKIVKQSEHKIITTAARDDVLRRMRLKQIREEMRMLYVAMTRAKERLEIVAAVKNADTFREKSMYRLDHGDHLDEFEITNASRMLDWIAPVAYGTGSFVVSENPQYTVGEAEENESEALKADETLAKKVYDRINYTYGYAASEDLPTKLTVSDIVAMKAGKDMGDGCERRPACMDHERLGGAEAGTATHAFLQFADFSRLDDVDGELERLVTERFITEKQAKMIDRRKLDNFISSNLFARIKAAKQATREFRFTFEADASEYFENAPNEKIIVQGAIDCVLSEGNDCVVIDYKTDRIKDEEALKEKTEYYAPQLKIYARGLRELTGKKVTEVILYFLDPGREVKIW